MKGNQDSNQKSQLYPPSPNIMQGKKQSSKEKNENNKNDFRDKMQSMHDKLKDGSKLDVVLSGDNGVDHSSYKMLDVNSGTQHQFDISSLEPERIRSFIKNVKSEKVLMQFSSKQSEYQFQVDRPHQKSNDFTNYFNESQKNDSFQNSFGPEQAMLFASHARMEQCSPNQGSSMNVMDFQKDNYFQKDNNFQSSKKQSHHKKSESSEESGTQESKQKIKMNEAVKSKQMDPKFSDQLKKHSKMIQITQNQMNCTSKQNEKCQSFCFKIQKFLRMKKDQNNFDRGVNILDHVLKNQMSSVNRIRQKVIQFISIIQSRYRKRKPNKLQQDELQLINDNSYYYMSNQSTKQQSLSILHKLFNKIFEFVNKIISSLTYLLPSFNLFMPTDTPIVIWDVFQIIITYGFLFLYSIQVFFAQVLITSHYMAKYFMFMLGFILSDVLIKFNTCYFEKDQIIQSRSKIAIKYLTSLIFFTDVSSLSAIFFKLKYQHAEISYNPDHKISMYFFNCLIFLLGNRLKEKRKRFDNIITLEENQKHIFRLFVQLFNVVSVAHFTSIAWHMLGVYEERQNYQISWISKAGILDNHYFEQYIYSMYWTITTMTTVGYGDISASNSTEALFITVMMILFSCVFAYSINNIGFILQEIEKSSKKLNDNLSIIQRYLNRKNVDTSLKSRVRHYLNFLAEESKNRDKEAEDEIIGILSNKLRDEITQQINTKVLNRFHLFSSNFSSKTMKQIVFIMEEVLVSPNQIIFQEDDVGDQAIYFIQSGIIEIFSNKLTKQDGSCVIFQQLSTNQLFGEISFFSGLPRKASARSVNLSTMYKIQREKFIELLKSNEEDFERMKMMQEQIIFQQNLKCLYLQCYCCKQLGHIASKCTKINPNFDKQFIILKNNFSKVQERNKYSRIERKFSCSKLLLKKNKNICRKIKDECREYNTQTRLLYANDSEDEAVQSNDEGQLSLSSSDLSSRSGCEKSKLTKIKSNFMNTQKFQDIEKYQHTQTLAPKSTLQMAYELEHNDGEQSVFQSNIKSYSNSESDTIDDVVFNNLTQKVDKQRHSQLESLNHPTSYKQISHFSQLFPEQFNHFEQRKQAISITQQNQVIQGSEEKIQSLQKLNLQDLMNKYNNNNNSLQSIDGDLVSSHNQHIGSKKNLDLNINTVNIQGVSQKDQRNYFNITKDQFKKINEGNSEDSELPPISKLIKKVSSFNQTHNIYDEIHNYFNNTSECERLEMNEDVIIQNKQNNNNKIEGIERKRFSQNKQNQFLQQKSQISSFQQQIHKTMKITKENSPTNNKLIRKSKFQTPDIDLEALLKINQLNQFLQQNKQDQDFFKYQLECLDVFDQMKVYKKFFPHNNIDKVIYSLRQLQNEKKKKKKISNKHRRRSNVMLKLDTISHQLVAHQNQKGVQEDFIIQKPTYLSYGVYVPNQCIYPKQYI